MRNLHLSQDGLDSVSISFFVLAGYQSRPFVMVWTEKNHLPDMIEMRVDKERCDGVFTKKSQLPVEFRASTYEMSIDDTTVSVGFSKAWIFLRGDGVEISPGDRLGEPIVSISSKSKLTTESTSEASAAAAAGIGVNTGTGVSLELTAAAKGAASIKETIVSEAEIETRTIVAKPNGKWLITSRSESDPLDASYLMGDSLCFISPAESANRNALEISVICNKRDIVVRSVSSKSGGLFGWKSGAPNKEKVFKALLLKCISNNTNAPPQSPALLVTEIKNYHED